MGVIGGSGGWVSGTSGSGPELTPEAADLLSDLGSIAKNAEPGWFGGFDKSSGVSELGTKVVSDGRVTEREVRQLVTEAYDYGAMTAPEKTALRSLLSRHGSKFDPAARAGLARFLGVKDSRGSAPDNSLFAALRPGAASPTERDNLNSIDAGFDFWRHTESEGGTARAATAVKTAEKYLSTSLGDWTVSKADKSKAAAALEELSPKEFLWALHQLWSEFRADGTSEASQTRSAFLFQPAHRAMTDKKLDQVEAYFENTIQDPRAREVALDYLTTMRTQAWPR